MMLQHDSGSDRSSRVLGLEGAEATLTYMRRAPGALWGIASLLASLTLLTLWLIELSQSVGQWLLLVGITAALVARWQLKTTFGLVLAGPAIACILGGGAAWVAGSTDWLWIAAVLGALGGLWALGRYGQALLVQRDSLNIGKNLDCRIVFFRPFDTRYAEWARNLVLPLLKNYGLVTHVSDRAFEDSPGRGGLSGAYGDFVKDVLSRMDEYDEPTRKMIEMTKAAGGADMLSGKSFDDATWRDGVCKILDKTDVAAVDVSTVSDNVLWELTNCYCRLTPAHVILIASRDALQDVTRRQDALLAVFSEAGIAGTQPVLVYHPTIALKFAEELHERMSEIHPAVQPAH